MLSPKYNEIPMWEHISSIQIKTGDKAHETSIVENLGIVKRDSSLCSYELKLEKTL